MKKLLRYLKSLKAPKPVQEARVKTAHEVALKQVVARRRAEQAKAAAAGEGADAVGDKVGESAPVVQPQVQEGAGTVKAENAGKQRRKAKKASRLIGDAADAKAERRRRRRQNKE